MPPLLKVKCKKCGKEFYSVWTIPKYCDECRLKMKPYRICKICGFMTKSDEDIVRHLAKNYKIPEENCTIQIIQIKREETNGTNRKESGRKHK